MSAKASGAQPNGTPGGAHNRTHHDGRSGRAFTAEQKAAVIRVKRCKATDFYDVLGLQEVRKTCTDGEIKKAYRKLSLLTHPDKNGYEGADEAFKTVSRAFQILSDPDKKAKYDRFGGDPDSRFGGGGGGGAPSASPFSGFASPRAGRGPMFEEEISPEEMFRQFFGGGGMGGGPFGGGLFDTGPGFVFNMGGGPGVRMHQFGGARPRRRPHNHANAEQQSPLGALQSLLPLLLLVLLPVLSSLFSSANPSGPTIRFDSPVPPHTLSHTSNRLKVPYWVNPSEVEDYSTKKWRELDKVAERKYVGSLTSECEWEEAQRRRLAQDAQGFFFTDMEKLSRAKNMELKNCRKLKELGMSGTTRW